MVARAFREAKQCHSEMTLTLLIPYYLLRGLTELSKKYDAMAMYGVSDVTGPQHMAEIGDIRNYPRRSSIVAFAGIDPEVDDSGKKHSESNPSTKRGSPHLRKTLFQIMSTYLKLSPLDEPVYQFIDKKRAEGKPFTLT